MLFKAPSTLSNWNFQFKSNMIPRNLLIFQHQNPVRSIISTYQQNDHQKFKRFFTKTTTTTKQPQNEQEIIQQVKNLLDGKNGVRKDPFKAVQLLKNLVDQGSTRAMIMYAGMAENGVGFSHPDIKLAHEYYKKAAETSKTPESTLHYLQHLKHHHDQSELRSVIKSIESDSDGSRIFVLGLLYLHENDLKECEKYLKIAISKGSVDAMILESSLLIKSQPEESMSLLQKAIEKGSHVAMYGYASYLAKGEFKSIKEGRDKIAFRYMKEAANSVKIRDAVVTLAEWLLAGFCCERNVDEALKYYKKAADSFDDPFSQYFYGSSLLCGSDSTKKKAGFEYLKKSADNNFSDAVFKLGFCFLNGNGVGKNISEANKCFKLAADSENADCDMVLNYAIRLLVGEGIKKNEKEAERYLKLGADNGNKMCMQFLKNLNEMK